MPVITVLTSVHNGMPYLPAAVESILNQTLSDSVYVIVDDGSTDGSAEYLASLRDPRLKIVSEGRLGRGIAMNRGLDRCRTELVAIMDADDLSLPNRLERQVRFLQNRPEVGVVGTQFAYFGSQPRQVFSPPMPMEHETILGDMLHDRLALVHGTLACRTEVIRKIGGYHITGVGEDWDLILRMAEVSRLANLPDLLYRWRIHAGSVNYNHLQQVQTRNRHAMLCAQRRRQGQPEIAFDDYVQQLHRRPWWQRAAESADYYALTLYRRAMEDILNSHPLRGYRRLAWASLCSPRRLATRIYRALRFPRCSRVTGPKEDYS